MPQIINTNIASLSAQRNLNKSQSANQQALSRLSSGLRINSAKDDAAGLAISTRFTSQVKGLNVAIRNVGDGVSLAQTADGALGTMTDNLQRMRELAIQSANATNSDVDREALQAEVDQLVAEISRTGEQTTFNGIQLLSGDFDATFQIGANVGETVSFGISELTADALGGGRAAGVSALGSNNSLSNGDLVINGTVVGASIAADDSASTVNAASSAISKAAAINKVSDQTGVEATALTNIASGTAQQAASGGANATSGSINLNGVDISIATGDVDTSADRAAVVTAINAHSAETGVVAVDSGSTAGGVTLQAEDGRNIALSFSSEGSDNLSAASTGLTSNEVSVGGYTLTSVDGTSAIEVAAGTGDISNAGLVAGSFSANTAAVNTISRSSRAEVTSDVGDISAKAATITGGQAVDLTNANFSAGDTTFVLEITGATSGFEDGTATVTLDKDYRSLSAQDLVDDINEDLAGNLAAEAFLDGDKLFFRRTSEEAGDLQFKNVTTGSVAGGNTTIIASLGLESTDTLGGAVTTLDSDTNAARGGQAGRAELTGTDAVAASLEGATAFQAADYSGTGGAQFDIIVAGADTAADNGTYTVQVDTDFSNSLYADFTLDADDAQRVLDELNEDLANAGAGDVIEAKFNDARTSLVFERKNAESNGSVEVNNYVASLGTDAATQATNFGFAAGRINTDTSSGVVAFNTVGADAKAAGAADAIGGSATGIDTDNALIDGGYDGVNDDGRFLTLTSDSAASVASAGGFTDDYSVNTATFTLDDGTTQTDITLDADYTSLQLTVDELNSQLAADGSLITASHDGSDVTFTSSVVGSASEVTITNIDAALGDVATGLTNLDTDSGTDGNHNLTFNLGGEDIAIDLRSAPTVGGDAYDDAAAAGGTILASYIDSFTGVDASFDVATNSFTVSATDGTTDLTLVNGDNSALEYLGLSAGTFEHTPEVTGTATQDAVVLSALNEGDVKINGVTISSSSASDDTASNDTANSSDKASSGISIAAAINASSSETGVTAQANATVVDGGSSSVGTTARTADGDQGTVYINGVATSSLALGTDSEANRSNAIAAINNISGQSGVVAEDAGGFIRLTASDGRNISIAIDNEGTSFTGSNIGLSSSQAGIGEADFSTAGNNFATTAETTASTVTLSSAKEFSIAAGTNGTDGLVGLGLAAGTYGGAEDGQYLADLDITSVEGAEAAILALDNALATVSSERSNLGAIQNRLESTVGNLTVSAENLTAANSRITDADFAVETAELSKSQVLQQAGISILAQANASSQQVLSLLG